MARSVGWFQRVWCRLVGHDWREIGRLNEAGWAECRRCEGNGTW